MDEIRVGRLIGGFARAGKVTAEEYAAAQPDPVAPFSGPVCGHMNEDHVVEVMVRGGGGVICCDLFAFFNTRFV